MFSQFRVLNSSFVFKFYRFLDIKIEGCDKLPTTLCQTCTTKVEDMQNFYNHCQDAQKMLAVQFGVPISEEGIEDQTIMTVSTQNTITNLMVKESADSVLPISSSTVTLTADKLLETAIKDTCILSGEDSEESDLTEGLSDEEQSGIDDEKVCISLKISV